jgi:hypothetical protein
MGEDVIALFELALSGDELKIKDQRHYQLVPADSITESDLKSYRRRGT